MKKTQDYIDELKSKMVAERADVRKDLTDKKVKRSDYVGWVRQLKATEDKERATILKQEIKSVDDQTEIEIKSAQDK